MPQVIKRQTNAKWGIWTTISDGWIVDDLTLEEAVEIHYDRRIREMESNLAWAKFRRAEFLQMVKDNKIKVDDYEFGKDYRDVNGNVPDFPPIKEPSSA